MSAPSLSELTGGSKTTSDIKSTPTRLRYYQAPAVGPGTGRNGPIRLVFPKTRYLDVSSLRFRGALNVTTTDDDARLAADTMTALIDRCKITVKNNVIYDQRQNPLISNFMTNALVTEHSYSSFSNSLRDYPQDKNKYSQVITAHTANRVVVSPLGPDGSFVNMQSLWPLGQMSSPIFVDIWFSDPNMVFKSVDANLTYQLDNFELIYSAIDSPSLDNYYLNNSVSITPPNTPGITTKSLQELPRRTC
jgi:hypothetical protein